MDDLYKTYKLRCENDRHVLQKKMMSIIIFGHSSESSTTIALFCTYFSIYIREEEKKEKQFFKHLAQYACSTAEKIIPLSEIVHDPILFSIMISAYRHDFS